MIKYYWAVFLLLVGVGAPGVAHAQASVYGEFSVGDFHNLLSTDYLSGVTLGVMVDGPHLLHAVMVQGNLQTRFVGGSGQSFDSLTLGPRLSVPTHFAGLAPYGEFLIGFARYHGNALNAPYNGTGNNTTDGTLQVNVGATKQVSPHWDAVAEYSYAQFYGNGGQFNPKTFSAGAVFHFTKR